MSKTPLTLNLIVGLFILTASTVWAQGISFLTLVDGNGNEVTYSIDDLDKIDQTSFSTTTIWTEGVNTFSGVTLHALMEHAGIEAQVLELVALNDYAIEIPYSDVTADLPLVATRMNDAPMSVRNKGPYWVVYPYDSDAAFQNEVIYARSIWQLRKINVKE